MASWLQNIISFGAAGRIEDAVEEYNSIFNVYRAHFEDVERRRDEVAGVLQGLVLAKHSAYRSLKRVREVVQNISPKDRQFIKRHSLNRSRALDLQSVEGTLSAGDLATSGATGVGAGLSTAAGAWALVGTLGTASTGTALSSLSGVALTNATLAWFGGGSLAAGGMGMAGGAMVLGGIVLAPAAVLTAGFAHVKANKKIAEIKEAAEKVVVEIDSLQKAKRTLNAIELRAGEMSRSLEKSEEAFLVVLESAKRDLKLDSLWQRFLAWLQQTFFGKTYSDEQVAIIASVGTAATQLARLIDRPLLDENGQLI